MRSFWPCEPNGADPAVGRSDQRGQWGSRAVAVHAHAKAIDRHSHRLVHRGRCLETTAFFGRMSCDTTGPLPLGPAHVHRLENVFAMQARQQGEHRDCALDPKLDKPYSSRFQVKRLVQIVELAVVGARLQAPLHESRCNGNGAVSHFRELCEFNALTL